MHMQQNYGTHFLFQIFFATLRVIVYLTILSIVADNSNLLRLSSLVSNSLMLQRIRRIYMVGGPDVILIDSSKPRQLYRMKNVCLPYKERFLDTILCGEEDIKGYT